MKRKRVPDGVCAFAIYNMEEGWKSMNGKGKGIDGLLPLQRLVDQL